MANVQILKLLSGEELVADVIEQNDETMVINNPLVVQVVGVDQNTNSLQIQMLPYMITRPEGKIEMFMSALAMPMFEADLAMEKQYLQQTSGIQLVS